MLDSPPPDREAARLPVSRNRYRTRRAARAEHFELTERELEVLRCLVQGMSYKRVARELDVSLDTVRSHIRSVYSKLQVNKVAEAVSRALQEGIV